MEQPMIHEIIAKSILRKHQHIDSWFISSYGANLYRGCTHNCVYCDGRNEKYQVDGEFGRDISIKINALDLLEKELNPAGKRKPISGGFLVICGGVSDSYQPFEKKYEITRRTLELVHRFNYPVHMLTKSALIERDIDLLQKIHAQKKAIVSFSFSSVSDAVSKLLEPGASLPSERLAALRKCKDAGLHSGMYLMPVVPFLTDSREMIEQSIADAKNAGVDFVIFGGMTLKPGRQKEHFMAFLKKHFPDLIPKYEQLYSDNNSWGASDAAYAASIDRLFDEAATKHKMPKRIPAKIFLPLVSQDELVILILEQLHYLVKLKGDISPYGFAAHSLSKIGKPIASLSDDELLQIKGIGHVTAKLIREIVTTGKCNYYEKML
jgi:DNA repair photolyase